MRLRSWRTLQKGNPTPLTPPSPRVCVADGIPNIADLLQHLEDAKEDACSFTYYVISELYLCIFACELCMQHAYMLL